MFGLGQSLLFCLLFCEYLRTNKVNVRNSFKKSQERSDIDLLVKHTEEIHPTNLFFTGAIAYKSFLNTWRSRRLSSLSDFVWPFTWILLNIREIFYIVRQKFILEFIWSFPSSGKSSTNLFRDSSRIFFSYFSSVVLPKTSVRFPWSMFPKICKV